MAERGVPEVTIYTDKDGCYKIPDIGETATSGLAVAVDRKFILEPVKDPHYTEEQRQQLKTLVEKDNVTPEEFYRAQSHQQLGREEDRFDVPIWIDPALDDEWKRCLEHGIAEINKAGPGLNLYTVPTEDDSKIYVIEHDDPRKAATGGSVLDSEGPLQGRARIRLGKEWSDDRKERTATHEMLHALGFEHEHQRSDSAANRAIQPGSSMSNQVQASGRYIGISRFDPYSIMLYCECETHFTRRAGGDSVWEQKKDNSDNTKMSELDKVGLNLMFRPCKHPDYNPVISPRTGMVYCGRDVMEDHNTPHDPVSTKCGPETGANCPACRTINTTRLKEIWGQGKWQGWSGLVYCGKPFGRRQFVLFGPQQLCGPNNGEPCDKCKKMLAI